MALNKPNLQLRRDLKDAAAALDDVAHELFREARESGDAAVLAAGVKIAALHTHIDALIAYADEVRDGRIVRGRSE
jgi:ketosteroid isomerase-like protein